MTTWLKKYWGLLVAAVAAIFGVVIAILVPRRPKPPTRPETPDVVIPITPPLHTTPADDYQRDKEPPKTDGDAVADDINRRYR